MTNFERILVTGAAGFVGRHASDALARAWPQARRVALLRPGETGTPPGFEGVVADLDDEGAIDALVARIKPDLVVHLAGQASIGQAEKATDLTWRTNFHGSYGLGAAVARHAPDAVLFFSSSATVYGASFLEGAPAEDAPLRPLEAYGRSKVAAEYALSDLVRPTGRLIIVRPVNHSGPGQRSPNFVLASFAAQIAAIEAGRAEPRMHVGDLSKARDFLDVRDVVDAYVRLIACVRDLPDRVSIFNVASGEAYEIGAILDEFRRRARRPFEVIVDPGRLRPAAVDIPRVVCDPSKLRALTGWRPRYSLGDLVGDLLDECRVAQAAASRS
jgi:GDP-4-dehydro-6-deoxy-D-mannose reductase